MRLIGGGGVHVGLNASGKVLSLSHVILDLWPLSETLLEPQRLVSLFLGDQEVASRLMGALERGMS